MIFSVAPKKIIGHLNGSSHRLSYGLGHVADSNSIPRSQTTTFHPVLIAAILLKYLLSLFERLFQQRHLSRIDEVLKCGDSEMDLNMLSQIPTNCRRAQLFVARELRWSSRMCRRHDVGCKVEQRISLATTSPTRRKETEKKAPLDVLREDKMDSPIHTNCIQPGGATTLIFIVDEATPSVPSSYAQ